MGRFIELINSAVDGAVGVFSPRLAFERKYFRRHLALEKKRSAKYAAAESYLTTGSWSPVNSNVNEVIKNSWPTVTTRMRQLVRDFPYFKRAVNILVDYVVGQGITFQSRIQSPGGTLNKKLIQSMEDAFSFWADEADVAGKLHFYEIMQLAKRQDIESGEFLIVKTAHRVKNKYLPFALQVYETDWLTDYGASPASPLNEVSQGLEYEKDTGRIIAYHLTDPDSWGKTIRIPAENVIHGFETLRPGQLRGISPFTAAVMVAHDLADYLDAEIDAAKMAAKYLAFVKTNAPYGRQYGRIVTDSDTGKKIESMENAIIEYLRAGEDITIASNPRPGSNFSPTVKLILQMVAVVTGAPYELLSGDYGGFSFSTARTARNDFSQQLRPIAVRHVRHFCTPILKGFAESAVMHGKLPFPAYFTNPAPYLRGEWQPPGMEPVDPLRETKSHIDEVKALLRSPQEIVKARGRDLEEVYKEIKAAKEMAEEYGLDFAEIFQAVNTALANNPAAVEDQDGIRAELIDITDRLMEAMDR